jgi:hypothetical protein
MLSYYCFFLAIIKVLLLSSIHSTNPSIHTFAAAESLNLNKANSTPQLPLQSGQFTAEGYLIINVLFLPEKELVLLEYEHHIHAERYHMKIDDKGPFVTFHIHWLPQASLLSCILSRASISSFDSCIIYSLQFWGAKSMISYNTSKELIEIHGEGVAKIFTRTASFCNKIQFESGQWILPNGN